MQPKSKLEQATCRFWDAASVLRAWRNDNSAFFEATGLGDHVGRTAVAMTAHDMLHGLQASGIVPIAWRADQLLTEKRRENVLPFTKGGPGAA